MTAAAAADAAADRRDADAATAGREGRGRAAAERGAVERGGASDVETECPRRRAETMMLCSALPARHRCCCCCCCSLAEERAAAAGSRGCLKRGGAVPGSIGSRVTEERKRGEKSKKKSVRSLRVSLDLDLFEPFSPSPSPPPQSSRLFSHFPPAEPGWLAVRSFAGATARARSQGRKREIKNRKESRVEVEGAGRRKEARGTEEAQEEEKTVRIEKAGEKEKNGG